MEELDFGDVLEVEQIDNIAVLKLNPQITFEQKLTEACGMLALYSLQAGIDLAQTHLVLLNEDVQASAASIQTIQGLENQGVRVSAMTAKPLNIIERFDTFFRPNKASAFSKDFPFTKPIESRSLKNHRGRVIREIAEKLLIESNCTTGDPRHLIAMFGENFEIFKSIVEEIKRNPQVKKIDFQFLFLSESTPKEN